MSAATLRANWPILVVIAAGFVTWGATTAEIRHLTQRQDTVEQDVKTDHSTIVEIRTEQRLLREDVREIKEAVKQVAERTR